MSLVVLVPAGSPPVPACEAALRALEARPIPVWRYAGFSAVDIVRNQLATDALAAGFTELMWVDTDIAFDPADVDRLLAHDQPFVCGLYPKKGPREFACAFFPDTPAVTFGVGGGLVPVRYCGFGFALVRRPVFEAVRQGLPECNRLFGKPLVPYFAPLVTGETEADAWYLAEDYAFCERARRAGVEVLADTTIRLGHVGSYAYTWDDVAGPRPRHPTTTVRPTSPAAEPAR